MADETVSRPVGRRPGTPKTGGKRIGSKNKPKPIILAPTDENRQLALMAPTLAKEVRTPKFVMLSAMMRFDDLSKELMAKAKRMAKSSRPLAEIREVMAESYRFTIAAVQCAEKVAPYVHPRLLAIESRGDNVDPLVPFVLRAPSVVEDSAKWQEMVSQQGVVLDKAEREAVREAENNAPRASGDRMEGMPHPAMPSGSAGSGAPASEPVVLVADPKTSRIMPAGPVVVRPAGAEEWLEAVARDRSIRLAR
jgi:hypothetical protein